jgi:hypothetical protein
MSERMSDTEMINLLESLIAAGGITGWKIVGLYGGRGWLLKNTTELPNYPTVRDAIQVFRDRQDQ